MGVFLENNLTVITLLCFQSFSSVNWPKRMPPAISKPQHRLVSFSLQHTNPNGRYCSRTETLTDTFGHKHNRYCTLLLQDIATNGRFRYRTLQHGDTTAIDASATEYYGIWISTPIDVTATEPYTTVDGRYRYRKLEYFNITADGCYRYRLLRHMDTTADRLNYYRTLQDLDITTNGRYRYRTLQHIDTTADRIYCYRTVQHKDIIVMDSTATEYYNTWIPTPIDVTATVHYSKLL